MSEAGPSSSLSHSDRLALLAVGPVPVGAHLETLPAASTVAEVLKGLGIGLARGLALDYVGTGAMAPRARPVGSEGRRTACYRKRSRAARRSAVARAVRGARARGSWPRGTASTRTIKAR
ncbi:hypothetical protein ACIQV3_23295 [Streptomyces sp. NPDC099050]|uniref:hypothetical protein n=1 Tax=Streptomyces sp. NPDC099050 TaxID=3366100 RepID=UPI0038071A0C